MKFSKNELKRIILEEMARSQGLKRLLSERGEVDWTTLGDSGGATNTKGAKRKLSAQGTLYGTSEDHYVSEEDKEAFRRGEAPGYPHTFYFDKYGKDKIATKLDVTGPDASVFDRSGLSDTELNAMINKNTPKDGDANIGVADRTTKRQSLDAVINTLMDAQAEADEAGLEGVSNKILEAMLALSNMNMNF